MRKDESSANTVVRIWRTYVQESVILWFEEPRRRVRVRLSVAEEKEAEEMKVVEDIMNLWCGWGVVKGGV